VRIALTISAMAHAMMWVPLVMPGPEPLVPAAETAIVAEIVTPDDVPELQKAETQPTDKPAAPAPAPETTSAAAEHAPSPPPVPQKREAQAADRTPGSKPNPQSKPQKLASASPLTPQAATPQAKQPDPTPAEAQTAPSETAPSPAQPQMWGSWLDSAMTSPLAAKASGMDPAEQGANIPQKDIDAFKAKLKECWKPPQSVAGAGNLMVVLRVSLQRNGTLAAEPSLIAASGSEQGPLLMRAAMQALRECQPYAFLPAKQYKEWKLLDLAFSPAGLTGLPRI
jgi:outer membrane biosynthesis protein TonB